LSSLASEALMITLFVGWEFHTLRMIPMHLFRLLAFAPGNLAMFCLTGALMSAIFFMAQFQQAALGAVPLTAGLRLLPWRIAVVVGARIVVPFVERFEEAFVVALGLAVQAADLAWLAVIADLDMTYSGMFPPMILAVVGAVEMTDVGKASGALGTIRQFGGVFGEALTAAAVGRTETHLTPIAFNHGFSAAIEVAASLSLAGAGAGPFLPRTHGKRGTA
jgi:hypothetical protein